MKPIDAPDLPPEAFDINPHAKCNHEWRFMSHLEDGEWVCSLCTHLEQITRERDEAREYILNALHYLEMTSKDSNWNTLYVNTATAWLKKALFHLEAKKP